MNFIQPNFQHFIVIIHHPFINYGNKFFLFELFFFVSLSKKRLNFLLNFTKNLYSFICFLFVNKNFSHVLKL